MGWSKLHSTGWLYGAIRKCSPEIRSVWPDLQAQAEVSIVRGVVCAAPGVGYGLEMLSSMWKTPLEIIVQALDFFKSQRCSDDPADPKYNIFWITVNADGTIVLNEWLRFQDEYQRLKKYRGTEKGTPKSTPSDLDLDPDIDTDLEEKKKNKYLDFVFLSSDEYSKLEKKYGKKDTEECIEFLDAYLTNNEKKRKQYQSHYKVILTWVYNAILEKRGKAGGGIFDN